MMTETELTAASVAYAKNREAVVALLVKLDARIVALDAKQASDSRNWGYAGDMKRIVELLTECAR